MFARYTAEVVDAAEAVERSRVLVEELAALPPDREDARGVIDEIHRLLGRLKSRLGWARFAFRHRRTETWRTVRRRTF
jgi:hypothetical protein